jgi:hypothetical protein
MRVFKSGIEGGRLRGGNVNEAAFFRHINQESDSD